MKPPLVTIITPSFNQAKYIVETIESVLSQDYPSIEYIVIDGGSTDGTPDILKRYSGTLTWISEPDKGQSHALNKGLRLAKGDIVGWLNSDDTYATVHAVTTAVKAFLNHRDVVMVYSDVYSIDENSSIRTKLVSGTYDRQSLGAKCYIHQPTVFLRRKAMNRVGPFDETIMTCMDYDYWIRVGKQYNERSVLYLNDVFLACARDHKESKTRRMRAKVYEEIFTVVCKHYQSIPVSWIDGYINDVLLAGQKEGILFEVKRAFLIIRLSGIRKAYRYIVGGGFTIVLRKLRNASGHK
jgi:glycosyltransferase involved in cell wall biosynthesis